MEKYEETLTDEDAQTLYRWIDKDDDGVIDMEDFMQMFMAL